MNDPIPDTPVRARKRPRAMIAAIVFVGALSAGGWWAGRNAGVEEPPVRKSHPRVAGNRLFDQVLAAVAQRYVDSLDASQLYTKAVSGLLRELGDPYTAFLEPDRLSKLDEQISGNYEGVGLQVDDRDGWITVIEPVPGSPAERAGVQAGDRLISVADHSTQGLTATEAAKSLRGPPGSRVTFVIERSGSSQKVPITVVREAVHVRAVPRAMMVANGVGYVDVNVFSQQTTDELRRGVDSLVGLGAHALILDLRGNPGGLLEQGVAVAELFLDPGQSIVDLRARPNTPPEHYADSTPQRWPTLALAVLVDRGSASASEIVAGALQDHDRAIVVGTTSFGKGSAQTVYRLSSGGALRMTTARWYTPVGRSISKLKPSVSDDDDAPRTPPDTARPRFKTEAGRTVLGGGGIAPDVAAGDTAPPVAVQQLAREMGPRVTAYRDAVAKLALQLKRSHTVTSTATPVTRDMLDALYADLVVRKAAPERATFDAAAPYIGRALGYEMTRVTFGPDSEFVRRSVDDGALQRAVQLLSGARTPREVFAHLDAKHGVEVPASR